MKINQDTPFTANTFSGSNSTLYALADKTTSTNEDGNVSYNAEAIQIENINDADEAIKNYKIATIKVTVESGKEFYADPQSRGDIADAITLMTANSMTFYKWKTTTEIEEVSLEELKEALQRGLEAKGRIVGID